MSLGVEKAAERIQLGPEAAGPGASPRSSAASIYRLAGYALCKRHSRYAMMRMLTVEEFCPTPEALKRLGLPAETCHTPSFGHDTSSSQGEPDKPAGVVLPGLAASFPGARRFFLGLGHGRRGRARRGNQFDVIRG